jgi:hypothetical protein
MGKVDSTAGWQQVSKTAAATSGGSRNVSKWLWVLFFNTNSYWLMQHGKRTVASCSGAITGSSTTGESCVKKL